MAMTMLPNQTLHCHQHIKGLRLVGSDSSVTVRSAKSGRLLRIESPAGQVLTIFRERKG